MYVYVYMYKNIYHVLLLFIEPSVMRRRHSLPPLHNGMVDEAFDIFPFQIYSDSNSGQTGNSGADGVAGSGEGVETLINVAECVSRKHHTPTYILYQCFSNF